MESLFPGDVSSFGNDLHSFFSSFSLSFSQKVGTGDMPFGRNGAQRCKISFLLPYWADQLLDACVS
jgi:hypothetical protein